MYVDPNSLFKGIRSMEGGISGAATKSGVSRPNLNEVVNGKRGLSLDTSRRVCKAIGDGTEPISLYVASQVRSMKHRRPFPGEVLATAAVVVKTLEMAKDEIRQLDGEAIDELSRHVDELGELTGAAVEATKNAPRERDGMGRAVRGGVESRRNSDGTSRKMVARVD